MRAVLVGLSGVATSLAAWSLSGSFSGLPGALFFMLAIVVVPVAVGVSIGIAVWPTSQRVDSSRRALSKRWIPSGMHSRSQSQCYECGASRILSGDVWVCATCDRIAALDGG